MNLGTILTRIAGPLLTKADALASSRRAVLVRGAEMTLILFVLWSLFDRPRTSIVGVVAVLLLDRYGPKPATSKGD